jgi:hypothetical protein
MNQISGEDQEKLQKTIDIEGNHITWDILTSHQETNMKADIFFKNLIHL